MIPHVYPLEGKRRHDRQTRKVIVAVKGRVLAIKTVRFCHQARQHLARFITDLLERIFGRMPAPDVVVSVTGAKPQNIPYIPWQRDDTRRLINSALAG